MTLSSGWESWGWLKPLRRFVCSPCVCVCVCVLVCVQRVIWAVISWLELRNAKHFWTWQPQVDWGFGCDTMWVCDDYSRRWCLLCSEIQSRTCVWLHIISTPVHYLYLSWGLSLPVLNLFPYCNSYIFLLPFFLLLIFFYIAPCVYILFPLYI